MGHRTALFLLLAVLSFNVPAMAGGRPCWDDVPPSQKFAKHHVVSGSGGQLSADGLDVSAKRTETERGILIELVVTNCSANIVEVLPNTFELMALGTEPQNDKRLTHLDPTQFQRTPISTYPALHPETLPYGRIGFYYLFFAPDTYFPNFDHNERLAVLVGQWQLEFYFPKKRSQ